MWRTPTPAVEVFPEPGASLLNVTLSVYGYVGCIVRYASAVQAISGTGMVAPTF